MVQNFLNLMEVKKMTEMRRVTIALPDEIDRKILDLRKSDNYIAQDTG